MELRNRASEVVAFENADVIKAWHFTSFSSPSSHLNVRCAVEPLVVLMIDYSRPLKCLSSAALVPRNREKLRCGGRACPTLSAARVLKNRWLLPSRHFIACLGFVFSEPNMNTPDRVKTLKPLGIDDNGFRRNEEVPLVRIQRAVCSNKPVRPRRASSIQHGRRMPVSGNKVAAGALLFSHANVTCQPGRVQVPTVGFAFLD